MSGCRSSREQGCRRVAGGKLGAAAEGSWEVAGGDRCWTAGGCADRGCWHLATETWVGLGQRSGCILRPSEELLAESTGYEGLSGRAPEGTAGSAGESRLPGRCLPFDTMCAKKK